VARVIKDVLLAMSYCHQIGISHRNLRPETVMIDLGKNVGGSKPKNLSIKITDFMQGAIGTPADKILTWDPKT
jgi:serine/threonine protein kinase